MDRVYMAIDLKSFYASVECVERGLDPLTTNLVVADKSRTEKTICLAVTPSLKAYGIPGRARLFEVVQKVEKINEVRLKKAPGHIFSGESANALELAADPALALQYIAAVPRMEKYMEYSTRIFDIYLKYFSRDDIYVYSIDECFIDATMYLNTYKLSARELCGMVIKDVLQTTGITATGGIGTNMYLCKVALDISAKKAPPDENGVRIAFLDEMTYRKELWTHEPLTDFWRVGKGTTERLARYGMYTFGDVARCSLGGEEDSYNEDLLYRIFGVNAELLIDHAWGREPATIADIKKYRPKNNSLSSGQVLHCPYDAEKARLIVQEMTDMLVLDIVQKRLVTDQIVLTIGYDTESLSNPDILKHYHGAVVTDMYGRKVPKHAHGTINLGTFSSSTKLIMEKTAELYDNIINPYLLIRRITIAANHVIYENAVPKEEPEFQQTDLFTDYEKLNDQAEKEKAERKQERALQEALIKIKGKYGKNAILKGMNFKEGATARDRNEQVGGHKA